MPRNIDVAGVEDEAAALKIIGLGPDIDPLFEHELDLGVGPVLVHELDLELGPGLGQDLGLATEVEPGLEQPGDLPIWVDSSNFGTGGVGLTVIIWKMVSREKLSAPQIPSMLLSLRHFSCFRATRY